MTLAALTMLLITFEGCARVSKTVVHPLVDDFTLVTAGETVTVKKNGAIVSDYWMNSVAGIEVEK